MKKIQFFINTFAVALTSLLFYSIREYSSLLSVNLVLLFSIISFSPLLVFKKEPIFSLIKIMPLIYFIFFPLFFILTWIGIYEPIPFYEIDSYNIALYYVLVGFYFFYMPFLLFAEKKDNNNITFFDKIKSIDDKNIISFTRFFVIATFILKGIQVISGFYFFLTLKDSKYYSMMFNFGFFNSFINSFQYFALFFLYVGWKKYNIQIYKKYLLYFVVILTLFNVPSGSKQAIFSSLIFIFTCFNLIEKKKIIKYLILLFVAYVATKSLITNYRTAVVSGETDIGFYGMAETYNSSDYTSDNTRNAFERLSLLHVVKSVFDYTPKYFPYEGFDNLLYDSAIVFIPRFIWPDKPIISKGNLMGKQYGVIVYENNMTSIGISQLGDFFRYGGLLYLMVGMFVIGLIYALLEKNFNSGFGFGRAFYFILFVNNLLWIERDLDAIYGIVIYSVTFIVFLIFLRLFSVKRSLKN